MNAPQSVNKNAPLDKTKESKRVSESSSNMERGFSLGIGASSWLLSFGMVPSTVEVVDVAPIQGHNKYSPYA